MIRRHTLVLAACCLAVAIRGYAATLDDLEQQIRRVVAERQAAERDRSLLVKEAASLADAISVAQAPREATGRASAALERQLREFDRIAGRLDAADRTIRSYDTNISRLQRAFATEIDRLTKELSQTDPRAATTRAMALETARQRIDALLAAPPTFRPLLVVRPDATDTVADLDDKLAVLTVEQTRGTAALEEVNRDISVLGGRTVVTRRLLNDLEATARAAPPDLRLVQRQVDEVQKRLRDYDAMLGDLRQARDTIAGGLSDVEHQLTECRSRRAALTARGKD